MPECPACGKDMRTESYGSIDYQQEQEPPASGRRFPGYIEITMYENYMCYHCGSKIRMATHKARYEEPKIEEIAKEDS